MRSPRWLPPVLLGLGALGGGALVLALEVQEAGGAPRGELAPTLSTPVLAVRRLPAVLAEPVAGRRLEADLARWAAAADEPRCVAVAGPTADLTFGMRDRDPLVPASTQKLLTATGVLLDIGLDAVFRTTVVAPAAPVAGVVAGDLTLIGSGDPLLASPDYVTRFERQPQVFTDLDQLAARIQEAGVRVVTGGVVGDEQRYDRLRSVPGWPQRYLDQQVVGPLSALTVNDGFESYPVPADPRPLISASDPAASAATVLTTLLERRGIDVVGAPRSGAAPEPRAEVAAIESPPMGEVLRQMLVESDNLTAEMLLKELGARAGDPSTAGGLARLRVALAEADVDLRGAAMADGSGLALDNRLTCALLVDLLTDPDLGPELLERVPVAGQTGTLTDRFGGTALEGSMRAKTGSLATVTALAGTVADDDPPLTFAYVVNVAAPARVPAEVFASQQALGEILLAWPRVPDADVLGPLPVVGP